MDAATKFIGGAIGRRVKRAYEERVVPAVSAKQDAMLREQIAIAERYPDLRACLTDNVSSWPEAAAWCRCPASAGGSPWSRPTPWWPSYGTAEPRAQIRSGPSTRNPACPCRGQVLALLVADNRQAGPERGHGPDGASQ